MENGERPQEPGERAVPSKGRAAMAELGSFKSPDQASKSNPERLNRSKAD